MEHLIALPSFDVFAYLMVGIAAIAMCDLYLGNRLLFRHELTVTVGTLVVIAAYVLGHVITTASTLLIELPVIDGYAGRPVLNLLATKEAEEGHAKPVRILLGPYFDRLDDAAQAKIRRKEPQKDNIYELFWQAYDTAKTDKHAFERIVTLQELYYFCRNMTLVVFLAAIIVIVRGRKATAGLHRLPRWLGNPLWHIAVFFVVSFVLFTRYLYFLRAHSIEVLTSYAYG